MIYYIVFKIEGNKFPSTKSLCEQNENDGVFFSNCVTFGETWAFGVQISCWYIEFVNVAGFLGPHKTELTADTKHQGKVKICKYTVKISKKYIYQEIHYICALFFSFF